MSCSSPRQSRDFTSPRMANRGISRQDTQPPRNQKDPAVHQGPPELFRSGSPPDLSFDWRLSPPLLFPSDGTKSFANNLREGRRTVASAFSSTLSECVQRRREDALTPPCTYPYSPARLWKAKAHPSFTRWKTAFP